MSEQSSQPDLQDRQLIPARSRVSLSQEIGEAVITHNIFGKARVRIIRKNDKLHRAMWLMALAGVAIIAAAAWQNWRVAQQSGTGSDVQAVTPGADVAKAAPASQSEAPLPLGNAQPVTPVQTDAVSAVPAVVVPAKPVLAPRPLMVRPQSAPPATNLLAPPQFSTSLPPKPVTTKPVAAPAVTPPLIKPQAAASSAAIAVPLSSPLAKEVPPAVEPTNQQSK